MDPIDPNKPPSTSAPPHEIPRAPPTPMGEDFITTSQTPGRTQDERTKALLAHVGVLVPILVPFLILRANGKESPFIRAHATEALNFQLTMLIPIVIGFLFTITLIGACIGLPIIGLFALLALIFSGVAALKASDGETYRYPLSIRFMS